MDVPPPEPVTIAVDDARRISALLQVPPEARACYVLAHGAGAGMTHPFMSSVAEGLAGIEFFDIVQQVQDAMWQPEYRRIQAC